MALSANTVWEIRTTGADTNSGGFVTGASGTDYSQQTGVQYTLTAMQTAGISATITTTSASADMVGNIINITAGTNFTLGFYQIVSVSVGVSITVDRNATTSVGSIGTGVIGGAFATLNKVATVAVAGNNIFISAIGTYTTATNITPTNAGTAGSPIIWQGYTSTRGDKGQITIQAAAGSINVMNASVTLHRFFNIIVDFNGNTSCIGFNMTGMTYCENCSAINFNTSNSGFVVAGDSTVFSCLASGGTSTPAAGFNINGNGLVKYSRATGIPGPGFLISSRGSVMYCISDSNTGASSDGFQVSNTLVTTIEHCVAYGNGRDGIRMTATPQGISINNCILVSNSGFGINNAGTSLSSVLKMNISFNAFYNNTSGVRNGIQAGSGDVTMSAVPFTNAGSNDFSLTNGMTGGFLCRAAGFPGTLQSGGVGFTDIGPLQHQDSGGTTVVSVECNNTAIVQRMGVSSY